MIQHFWRKGGKRRERKEKRKGGSLTQEGEGGADPRRAQRFFHPWEREVVQEPYSNVTTLGSSPEVSIL